MSCDGTSLTFVSRDGVKKFSFFIHLSYTCVPTKQGVLAGGVLWEGDWVEQVYWVKEVFSPKTLGIIL